MPALSKSRLGGLGLPSWLSDWLGKDLEDVYAEKYGGRYPGLAENVAVGTGSALKAVGVPKRIAETAGRNVTSLAEDWTPAGALTAVEEYGPVGALAAVPIVGGKGKKLAKGLGEAMDRLPNVEKTAAAIVDPAVPKGLGIKAYHGSPHSFEEFDISKIGTGEGAQAYGHGLYFAENEGVAKSYRDRLADKGNDNPGSMYEVDIAADPEAFLDWDKPLSEQSPAVREIMKGQGYSSPVTELPAQYSTLGYTGARELRNPEEVARLKEAGIPGIRYLDQGSRGLGGSGLTAVRRHLRNAEEDLAANPSDKSLQRDVEDWKSNVKAEEDRLAKGSRNYVVFDPKIVSIVKKYGIPAAIASGLISEEMGRRMQEQGDI